MARKFIIEDQQIKVNIEWDAVGLSPLVHNMVNDAVVRLRDAIDRAVRERAQDILLTPQATAGAQ